MHHTNRTVAYGSPLMPVYDQTLIPDDSWPFSIMVSEAFYTIGEMHPEVIPFNFMTSPPCICPQPKICFSHGSCTKKSCLPQDLLGTFFSHILSHIGSVHIYTDCSKTDTGVGEAFFL